MFSKDQFARYQPHLALGFAVILVSAIGISIWRDARTGRSPTQSGAQFGFLDSGSLVSSIVNTERFDGHYRLVADESFKDFRDELAAAESAAKLLKSSGKPLGADLKAKIAGIRFLLQSYEEQMESFTVRRGVIRCGRVLVMELSLIRATIEGDTLEGTALLHEDIHDPGDCQEVSIRLKLTDDRLEFAFGDAEEGASEPVILERVPPN